MINWIQNWFKEQCDGNWEHDYSIKIETLDNPSWHVAINFSYTDLDIDNIDWKLYETAETNWVGFSVTNSIFNGSGDPLKLDLILNIFKLLTENKKIDNEIIKSLLIE